MIGIEQRKNYQKPLPTFRRIQGKVKSNSIVLHLMFLEFCISRSINDFGPNGFRMMMFCIKKIYFSSAGFEKTRLHVWLLKL